MHYLLLVSLYFYFAKQGDTVTGGMLVTRNYVVQLILNTLLNLPNSPLLPRNFPTNTRRSFINSLLIAPKPVI